MANHPVKDLLVFDPLAAAEAIMGASYKEKGGVGDEVTALGMALAQQHSKLKKQVLKDRGDTTFHNTIERYTGIIEAAGFEEVLCVPFAGMYGPDEYLIYARRDGLLLSFDTFGGKSINGGNVYYNWRPSEEMLKDGRGGWLCGRGLVSSGGWNVRPGADKITPEDVWLGSHDCREALIFNMDRLAAAGEFVAPWVKAPSLWLFHYQERKEPSFDFAAIDAMKAARIAKLPAWVREMIGQ